jgi:hypothetical protein
MNRQRCKDAGFLLSRKISAVTAQLALRKPKFTNPSQTKKSLNASGAARFASRRGNGRKSRTNRGAYGAFRNKPTAINPATLNPTAKG